VNGETIRVRVPSQSDRGVPPEWIVIGDHPYDVFFDREFRHLRAHGQAHQMQVRDLQVTHTRPVSADGRIKAPIPGIVTQVLVEPGQAVETGQTLFILEAMKMENQIRAPRDGRLTQLNVSPGRGVQLGELLAEVA
jgi:biotin carboxyl carrier protein